MFLKDKCSDVIEEDSMSLTVSDIVHAWEFVIFTHFLITTHIFQPSFPVVFDLRRIGLISCIIDQTVDPVSHCLIFQGHRENLYISGVQDFDSLIIFILP